MTTVTVHVVDGSGAPVPDAKVTLHSAPQIAYTDAQGDATFTGVTLGEHQVMVQSGTISLQQAVNLSSATGMTVTYNLKTGATKVTENNDATEVKVPIWVWILGVIVLGVLAFLTIRRQRASSARSF